MAGHEWGDWFEREEFIGQISDIRVQNLQVEREMVQKRTFTRWMNLHLEKCDPPIEVQDLFHDIQDGRILMALLEELSGCKMLHGFKKSSHRIFRLNNIAKVLSFLEERNVKLVSIDAADVADGNSSIILGLIWNIILFFQIKELTGNIRSQFPSCSSLSSIPTSSDSDTSYSSTPSEDRQPSSSSMRDHSRAIKKLLQWVQKRTRKYGVAVQDFGKSWSSGLAFLAVIKSIDTSLVDMRKALLRSSRENLEDAFRTAHYSLGIPRLLDPEDLMVSSPDNQSIITYVSQFLEHFPGIEEPEEPCQVIERSVSMGRLNFRDSDSDHFKNGTLRSRVRDRSYVFRKDYVHPPPKILISSVSEDRGAMSPTFTPAGTRSWSSVDFLAESTQEEDVSTGVERDSQESSGEVFTNANSNSSQLSQAHSPSGSLVADSVNTEAVIGDSAISSPDSWVESDIGVTPDRFCESRSDSSLCDSGTAWDVNVPPATPEDASVLNEGLMSSIGDRPSEEHSISEMYIDEGIYSLSSLESTQDRIQSEKKHQEDKHVEKKEEANLLNRKLTHSSGLKEAENKTEEKSDPTNLQDQTSPLRPSDAEQLAKSGVVPTLELDETNQSQPDSHCKQPTPDHAEEVREQEGAEESTHRGSECLKEAEDLSGVAEDHEGQFNVETESLSERNKSEECKVETAGQIKDSPLEEPRKSDEEVLKMSEMQVEASEGVLGGHTDPQESTKTHSANQDTTSQTAQDPRRGHAENEHQGPSGESGIEETGTDVISPQNRDEVINNACEENDSKSPKIPVCLLSEHVQPNASGQVRDAENGHLPDGDQHGLKMASNSDSPGPDTVDNMETTESKEECESPQAHKMDLNARSSFTDAKNHPDHDVKRHSADQLNGYQDKLSANETDDAQNKKMDLINFQSDEETGSVRYESADAARDADSFFTNVDRSSPTEDLVGDPVEPMDLFYPDKEEPMFTEPDTESGSWPSVLSVSALQPAPASKSPPGTQNLSPIDEGTDLAVQEQDRVITESYQGTDKPSKWLDESSLPAERTGGRRGGAGPAEGDDVRDAKRQIPGSARENTEPVRIDSSRQDEIYIPTVLRHRKVAGFAEFTNDRNTTTVSTPEDTPDDRSMDSSELCLLLLLWLLLYCFWMLPQMDLKTLPSLLLNLDP